MSGHGRDSFGKAFDDMGGLTLNLLNVAMIADMFGAGNFTHDGVLIGPSILSNMSMGLVELNISRNGITSRLGTGGIDISMPIYQSIKTYNAARTEIAEKMIEGEQKTDSDNPLLDQKKDDSNLLDSYIKQMLLTNESSSNEAESQFDIFLIQSRNERSELTELQWETVSRVKDETVQYLDQMIGEIRLYANGTSGSVSPALLQNAAEWLGMDITDRSTAACLANDLVKIRNNLALKDRENFKYDKNTPHFSYIERLYPIINLGEGFFSRAREISNNNIDTKHGILVHESTHSLWVLNTQDIRRTHAGSRALVSDNPSRAQRNAMNWEMFFIYSLR